MSKDTTILVCCHKKDFCYDGEGFLPIQVGKAISQVDLEIQGDDTGDNISDKNPHYCELTAHYWLWKNMPDSKYIGLNHYRRYFDFLERYSSAYYYQNVTTKKITSSELDIPSNLDKIFKKYDVIMAKPMIYPVSLEIFYSISHSKEDLSKLRDVIQLLYPEYLRSFDDVMKGNRMSLCNMFLMTQKDFIEYSKWLFDILFEFEKRITVSKDPYQTRIFGFVAERLINVYIKHKSMKVKYLPIIKISEDKPLSRLKGYIRNVLNNIAYTIIKQGKNCKIIFEQKV